MQKKVLIIDNYDSFTYNLVHLVNELGRDVEVWRNDKFDLSDVAAYDQIILSPGPGIPEEQRTQVFSRGTRLDEQTDGHGLGLGIVRDIVETWGGLLVLGESEWGGLKVVIELPKR